MPHRLLHLLPPQSGPVSPPSVMLLKHDEQTPLVHCPLEQSASRTQCDPSAQGLQNDPPQSALVSSPFRFSSKQLTQIPANCASAVDAAAAKQYPLSQSASTLHGDPLAHDLPTVVHNEPPQSRPVSVLSCTPLLHNSSAVSALHRPSTLLPFETQASATAGTATMYIHVASGIAEQEDGMFPAAGVKIQALPPPTASQAELLPSSTTAAHADCTALRQKVSFLD
eukprot:SAG31_NODE_1653_length_7624_cov_3.068970_1_plen_224_part_10